MTLDDQILDALKAGDTLTPAVGEERWSCLALHSAIARLRKRGYTITCKMRRDAATRRIWGEYRLQQPEQLELLCAALPA